jgi:PAS domain S-box-containing protein
MPELAPEPEPEHAKPEHEHETQLAPPSNGAGPEQGGAQASILKKLPVPVLVYRMGETLYANPEMLSVTGYASLDELSAHGGIDALFSPEEGDNGHGGLSEGENGALMLLRRDGSHVRVNPMLQSVAWEGGRALLLSFRTPEPSGGGEKAAIDMARVSELQNILDTATDGILVTTREGQIESLNGPAEALFGIDQRQVSGKQLSELFAKESHRAVEEYMRELKEPGVAGLINNGREVIGLHAKGGLIPLFITLGKMGREEKFCAVLRDITPWKKAEEELVGARRAAESASEQKSEFLPCQPRDPHAAQRHHRLFRRDDRGAVRADRQ